MSLTFADTHNMVAYLNKSDASEGFNQVIDFLNGSYIQLQALVDKKKVVITEAAIRDVLRLDDAEGVDCLPNEEIFAELARMGYEKPSIMLTFYKAFFLSQWKFLIHTILQSMSAKRTSWNEFRSAMASAKVFSNMMRVGKGFSRVDTPLFEGMLVGVIEEGGRNFNFSKYIFESLVRNVDSSSKFYMYPRVGKGFSGVDIPLFEGMLVGVIEEGGDAEEQVQDVADDTATQGVDTAVLGVDVQDQSIPSPTPPTSPPQKPQDLPSTSQEALDACVALTRRVEHFEYDKLAQALEITKLKRRRIDTSDDTVMEDASNQGRMIDALDSNTDVSLMDDKEDEKKAEEAKVAGDDQVQRRQAEIYKIDMDHSSNVLSMQEDELKVQEVVDVITTAKLITKVVTAASELVTAASRTIAAAELQVPAATITDAPLKEHLEEEENRAIESINKTPAQKAAKRRKLNEEVEDLKRHLEIVPDEDDDVYTEATPLARKCCQAKVDVAGLVLLKDELMLLSQVNTANDILMLSRQS
nr:hypothetical protein [Tanacetum cinerariifolium]